MFVIFLLIIVSSQVQAQQVLPVAVVNRMYISDADLSRDQSFYYKRKEEFHQVLVYDLGEHSGKKAPADFYVDFLATREQVKPAFVVSIKWIQLIFFNGETELRSVTLPNSRPQRLENGVNKTVPQIQNEYRYIYPVKGHLEIQVYKVSSQGNELLMNTTKPILYDYMTPFKTTQRTGQWVKPPAAPSPAKPMIFKEVLAAHYDEIKKTVLSYFNSNEFAIAVKGN